MNVTVTDGTTRYVTYLAAEDFNVFEDGVKQELVSFVLTHGGRVYNEAAALTLSVWYPTGPRIELEPIGPRERLQPGESASFTEDWWLLPYPFPKEGQQVDLKLLADFVNASEGLRRSR